MTDKLMPTGPESQPTRLEEEQNQSVPEGNENIFYKAQQKLINLINKEQTNPQAMKQEAQRTSSQKEGEQKNSADMPGSEQNMVQEQGTLQANPVFSMDNQPAMLQPQQYMRDDYMFQQLSYIEQEQNHIYHFCSDKFKQLEQTLNFLGHQIDQQITQKRKIEEEKLQEQQKQQQELKQIKTQIEQQQGQFKQQHLHLSSATQNLNYTTDSIHPMHSNQTDPSTISGGTPHHLPADQVVVPQFLNKSCFPKCKNQHNLIYSNEHERKFQYVQCDSCKGNRICRLVCPACKVFYCLKCKPPYIHNSICPNGHEMKEQRIIYDQIVCDICMEKPKKGLQKTLYCQKCDFDICYSCVQSLKIDKKC